jgi:hypothetical protein
MAIVPGSEQSIVTPTRILRCRQTSVRATGKATAAARTAPAAAAEAHRAARACRDQAAAGALALRCPARGGCARGCRQRRTQRTGSGDSRTLPVKRGNNWVVTAREYYIYTVRCYCPPRAPAG